MKLYKRLVRVFPLLVLTVVSFAYAQQGNALKNPLSFDTIPQFFSALLKALVMVALPIISLFIVYTGFLFVFARGNETQLKRAKLNFLYVMIGAVLILGAWLIANLLGNTVTQLLP